MIELVADKAPDATASRVGYHVALGFGQAMNLVNREWPRRMFRALLLGPPSTITTSINISRKDIWNISLRWERGCRLMSESLSPRLARKLSRPRTTGTIRAELLLWAIPYFHFGMSGSMRSIRKFAVTGYLVNGWNNSIDNNSGKTTGFSAAWTPDASLA